MTDNNRHMKSYVWHGDDCIFISTIERDWGIPFGMGPETIVWEYDWEAPTGKEGRGKILWNSDCGVWKHLAIAKRWHEYGQIEEPNDD